MHAVANSAGSQLQLHLSLFTDHEIQAWEHEEERRQQRKAHRRSRTLHRFRFNDDGCSYLLFERLAPDELTGPLTGVFDPDNELNCESDPLQGADDDAGEEEPEFWSDAAVAQLHEAVLHHSLRALQARGNGVEKVEILKWIFAPDRLTASVLDARGQPQEVTVPQVFVPFSFERCCRICGYSPERMTDELIPILNRMGLGYVFNEISNGTTTSNNASSGAEDQAVQAARDLQPA